MTTKDDLNKLRAAVAYTPVPPAPQVPQRELTFGEKAVGLTFNPGGNLAVDTIKRQFADVINELHQHREETSSPEVKRMLSIAITEAQTAQMWAVKAVTWQY
jgi:hypothetical protein